MSKAIDIVLEQAQPLSPQLVNLEQAQGHVLAEPVYSQDPLPPFRASIMDGYAVIAADGTGEFPVVERIAAGVIPTQALTSGTVSYITTGSPVPDGADAVVKIEDTEAVDASIDNTHQEKSVRILVGVKAGQNIRPIGSDIVAGEKLLQPGDIITSAEIGLLATAGITQVKVHRQPVIGVLSTGSELLEASSAIAPGKIRDSNRPMLLALLREEAKAQVVDLGICADQKESLDKVVQNAFERVDVLITSGGVSMGDHDLIKPLLERIGKVHFGRLHMKPGKPTTFTTVIGANGSKKFIFALPGNPVSSFVTCHLLVQPAVKRMKGLPLNKCIHTRVHAVLSHAIRLDSERPEYHRATIQWDQKQMKFIAKSTGGQISSRLLSCRHANALLVLPTGTEIRSGDAVEAIILNGTFDNILKELNQPTPMAQIQPKVPQATTNTARIFKAALLTVSDTISKGKGKDLSGPAMKEMLLNCSYAKFKVVDTKVVPDEALEIQRVVKKWTDEDQVDLVLTSGGTGFSPRDVTPEAIKSIVDKEIPGFVMVMLQESLKVTPKGILSRPVAGIRHHALVLTLPGKPKAVSENFSAIENILPHALHLINDIPHEHHRANPSTLYT